MSNTTHERGDLVITAKGTIHAIDDQSQSQYPKMLFTVLVPNMNDSKYNNFITFEAYGEKMSYTNKLAIGDYVEIDCYVQGKRYTCKKTGAEKYFTNMSYKYTNIYTPAVVPSQPQPTAQHVQSYPAQAQPYQQPVNQQGQAHIPDFNEEIEDDIPF